VNSVADIFSRFNVSRESQDRIRLYVKLLGKWQKKINLVSGESLEIVWSRHVADALQLRPLIGVGPHTIVDIGSGAGLPGLVLALAFPDYRAVLIESNGKKAAFLREVARQARISIKVVQERIEKTDSGPYRSERTVITARALAPLNELLGLAGPFLGRGLFHKGQDVDRELNDAMKSWNIQFIKHPSVVDPRGTILEILEARYSHEQPRAKNRR
jgi:16S rRNA (guanine527-N7)-methyltransferase